MSTCVHVFFFFLVNLHESVTSTRCSHDQWWCWSIPQMGGGVGGGDIAGLWKDCLIVCPAESNTCRLTQLALQMDHLWHPTLTSLRGERLLDQGSWMSHVLSQVTWDMLLNNNGVFAALLQTLLSECPLYTFLKGHSSHGTTSDSSSVKAYVFHCISQMVRTCAMHPLLPPSPCLLLISFVCDRPRTWWAERRHFLGPEQLQCSIFPTCSCSIFNALHPSRSWKERQWRTWLLLNHVRYVEICYRTLTLMLMKRCHPVRKITWQIKIKIKIKIKMGFIHPSQRGNSLVTTARDATVQEKESEKYAWRTKTKHLTDASRSGIIIYLMIRLIRNTPKDIDFGSVHLCELKIVFLLLRKTKSERGSWINDFVQLRWRVADHVQTIGDKAEPPAES